jgi:hypothetical protein
MALTIQDLYQNVLGRAPDTGGLSFWQNYAATRGGPEIDPDEIAAFVAAAQAEKPGAAYTAPRTPTLVVPANYPVFGPTGPTQTPITPSTTPVPTPAPPPLRITPVTNENRTATPTPTPSPAPAPAPSSTTRSTTTTPSTGISSLFAKPRYTETVFRSNVPTIEQLYENVLNRRGDPSGLEFWQNYARTHGGPGVDLEDIAAFVKAAQTERPGAIYGGVPSAGPIPRNYAGATLLGSAAAGAPSVVAVPRYEPYSGIPAEKARPALNVSPENLGAKDIVASIASARAPGMREGGLAALASQVRDAGRGNDTILAHINPEEAGILKLLGGRGTINPQTGLPEFDWFSKNITRKVSKPLKQVAKVLPFVVPFIPGLNAFAPLISGIAGGFAGGKGFDFKRGLMSGLTAYGIGQLAQGAGAAGSQLTPGPATTFEFSPGDAASAATSSTAAVTPPNVPQFKTALPTGSTIGDYAKATLGNVEAATRGAGQALIPGAEGSAARSMIGQSFGPGTAAATYTGVTGTAALDEAEKFKQEQLALENEEEEKRNRFRELAYANMTANPYRLIAEGGYIDDNPVSDMAAGGLKEGSFIVPADVVAHIGNGSTDAGLKALARKYGAKPIKGPGDGMSDSIPTTIEGRQRARVADGEAIISPAMTAKVGPKQLYSMLDRVRKARTGTTKQGKQINPMRYLPA